MRSIPTLILALTALPRLLPAQEASRRPIPYPIVEPAAFGRAVAAGTRTRTGRPGPGYWQQRARYSLEATLDPAANRLAGRGTVRYENQSPDTLRALYLHLRQNLFAPGALRNDVEPITGGMHLSRVMLSGRELAPASPTAPDGYEITGTILRVPLGDPLLPGGTVEAAFEWSYTVNPDGGSRGGTDGETWFVSYWYPQLAVYDDVARRWQTDPYLGQAEFYMGYADYDVALTVPAGWLIGATGELVNTSEVLSPQTQARLAAARRGGDVVHVVTDEDRAAGRATASGGALTWRFRASNVRDFAFGTSDRYRWDATNAATGYVDGDRRPDTPLIQTFYRSSRVAWTWDRSAAFARQSIEWLSARLWPYPYPHATAVDGVTSCAGMEYPMITCIGGPRDTTALYSVIVHELGHQWFPMQVGSDEQRYAWMDEGLTRFNQSDAMNAYFAGMDRFASSLSRYLDLVRAGDEIEIMRHGDQFPVSTEAYSVQTYEKTNMALRALRAVLGDSVFQTAYREYGRRWVGRHPTPWDFWNTFEDVAGRDLDWFWRTWFFETWPLDQAIGEVRLRGRDLEVTIEDRGLAPMPVRLAVTRRDGTAERREVPVDVWLAGGRRTAVRLARGAEIERVEIDPEGLFPDVDRTNQRWTRGSASGGP